LLSSSSHNEVAEFMHLSIPAVDENGSASRQLSSSESIGWVLLVLFWPYRFVAATRIIILSRNLILFSFVCACRITFGGMCSWRRVAVARVFALVVRCRVMRLIVYSRVGKNRDTSGGPRREPGRPAPPLKLFNFDQKILAVQKPIAYTDLLASVLIQPTKNCIGIPVNNNLKCVR